MLTIVGNGYTIVTELMTVGRHTIVATLTMVGKR